MHSVFLVDGSQLQVVDIMKVSLLIVVWAHAIPILMSDISLEIGASNCCERNWPIARDKCIFLVQTVFSFEKFDFERLCNQCLFNLFANFY